MKVYRQVDEDAEYREYYDSYRITVDNLNDTDFLYKSNLSNGQVFFAADEIYGFVNNQAAIRGRNLTITRDYIDDFVIRDFKVYTRNTNELLDININCNLYNYRDGKPHYLYIVLSHRGTYEVYDDMFQSDETKIVFARFIIDTQGNSKQFYMMLPFAGSADYIKGNQLYQVTDGLRLEIVNDITKQFTLTKAKIRFSGINFDDVSSPDCLSVDFEGNSVPIRYSSIWDNNDKVTRVDWISDASSTLDLTKIINYTTGTKSTIPEDKFSIQKLYYDVYEKCIIAMYGNAVYNTREEAILNIDSVMNYTLPDGIEYLIPIAAIIVQNSSDPLDDNNFRIINLDYNEKEVLDSDTFTRQQSSEAINKANQAVTRVNELDTSLSNHTGDRTNPHRVRLDQLYNSNNEPIILANDYADYSVSSILSAAATSAANLYYLKTGGTISGNVSIGTSSSIKNLTVFGTSTLKGNIATDGNISVGGALTSVNAGNIGTTSARFGTAYLTAIDTSGNASIGGSLTTAGSILPTTTTSFNIGSSDKRYDTIYGRSINMSGDSTISGRLTSGNLTTGNGTFTGEVTTPKLTVNNGYLIIGQYSLRLGSEGTIPTQTGYGIW